MQHAAAFVWLADVRPSLSSDDAGYMGLMHAELVRNALLAVNARNIEAANMTHIRRRQSRMSIPLAACRDFRSGIWSGGMPAFGFAVCGIVRRRSKEQVVQPNASSVIAFVADEHAGRDRAPIQLPYGAMGFGILPFVLNPPVAVFRQILVGPAAIASNRRRFKLRRESASNSPAAARSGAILSFAPEQFGGTWMEYAPTCRTGDCVLRKSGHSSDIAQSVSRPIST